MGQGDDMGCDAGSGIHPSPMDLASLSKTRIVLETSVWRNPSLGTRLRVPRS
jgi:hypothetical protein